MRQTRCRTLHARRHVDIQPPVQFVIADDHPGVVAAVRRLVSGVHGSEVVGGANNTDELLAMLAYARCDLAITDYAIPGSRYGDGILLFELLVRHHPDLRLVVLTMFETRALMSNILRTGVKVIVSKSDEPQHILEGMQATVDGHIYLSPLLNARLLHRNGEPQPAHDDPVAKLGKREPEVLRVYVIGRTVSEVAQQLNRNVRTISSQRQTAMRKLELDTEAALFDFAVRHGLLGSGEG